jgi:hypothetical protein
VDVIACHNKLYTLLVRKYYQVAVVAASIVTSNPSLRSPFKKIALQLVFVAQLWDPAVEPPLRQLCQTALVCFSRNEVPGHLASE